jgi:hypothetical protein
MRVFAITLVLLLLQTSAYSQCKSDLEKENVIGSVRSITQTGIFMNDDANEIISIATTSYNKSGVSLGYRHAHKNNDLKYTETTYELDALGRKIKMKSFELSGELEYYYVYEYDSLCNMIKSIEFKGSGRLDSYTIYEYNSTGESTGYKTYTSDSTLWLWYQFEYEAGTIGETRDPQDSSIWKSEYDKHNNEIKTTKYDKFGNEKEVRTYIYQYDNKSNWITRTLYINGKIYWIDKRRMIYY